MSDYDELHIFQQMIMSFDSPAFMRRARDVEAEWNAAVVKCRRQRHEWLEMSRLRLARLRAMLDGNWQRLFSAERARYLSRLWTEWNPVLQVQVSPVGSERVLRKEANALAASFEKFNQRWQKFVDEFDLAEVNRLRQGYNDFYVLEKECAVRSALVAGIGFTPLAPATTDELWQQFPLLQVPRPCQPDHG